MKAFQGRVVSLAPLPRYREVASIGEIRLFADRVRIFKLVQESHSYVGTEPFAVTYCISNHLYTSYGTLMRGIRQTRRD